MDCFRGNDWAAWMANVTDKMLVLKVVGMMETVKVDFLADLLVYEKADRKAVVLAVSRVVSMAFERVVWMVLDRVVSKDF